MPVRVNRLRHSSTFGLTGYLVLERGGGWVTRKYRKRVFGRLCQQFDLCPWHVAGVQVVPDIGNADGERDQCERDSVHHLIVSADGRGSHPARLGTLARGTPPAARSTSAASGYRDGGAAHHERWSPHVARRLTLD